MLELLATFLLWFGVGFVIGTIAAIAFNLATKP